MANRTVPFLVAVVVVLAAMVSCVTPRGALTLDEAGSIVDRVCAAVSAGDTVALNKVIDADAYVGHASGLTMRDSDVKASQAAMRKAMPDLTVAPEEVMVSGDRIIARFTWKGTSKGEYMGKPPTGKSFVGHSINIWRIAAAAAREALLHAWLPAGPVRSSAAGAGSCRARGRTDA